MAAEGLTGSPPAKGIVNFGLASLTLARLAAVVTIIVGLRRRRA